jgi:2-amino-4-hydroxy-6-hydroxymethyldihydropteridine diphosphokinase
LLTEPVLILIALGANLPSRHGRPHETLAAARAAMTARNLRIVRQSSTWLTAPVPVSDQPWYHNEVVALETELSPYGLLEALQAIEHEFGRVRTVRNAPRVLDLDLIAYNDVVLSKPELIVPHPRMHRRAFVLLPLREIAPDWEHPVLHTVLSDLIDNLPADQNAQMMSHAA